MAKLEPLGNRLIVKVDSPDHIRESGLVIPSTAQDRPQRGVVLEAGVEVEHLEPGDCVLFSKYGGAEIEIDGENLLVLTITDVLARIHD